MEKSPQSSQLLSIFLEEIDILISQKQWNKVISEIAVFVGAVTNDADSCGIVFSSSELDQACQKIARAYQALHEKDNSPKRSKFGTLVIITEVPKYGGHISLLRDLINLEMLEKPVNILATNYLVNTVDNSSFENYCRDKGIIFLNLRIADSKNILEEMQNIFNQFSPKNLMLMAHNHDALALVSCLMYEAEQKYFIHHGDHHLCLGAASSEFLHVDLTNWSYHHCKDHIGLKGNYYLPLVVCDPFEFNYSDFPEKEISNQFITCTSGRGSKFINDGMRFEDFVPMIMKVTNDNHVHIGEISDNQLSGIKSTCERLHVDFNRFIHIKKVDSLSKEWILQKVKLYLSSFPITGAKSNIEAMSLGLPIILFENPSSRILSGIDFTYPDALSWSSYAGLLKILEDLKVNPGILLEHSKFSKDYYLKYHSAINMGMNSLEFIGDVSTSYLPPLNPKKFSQLNKYLSQKNLKNEIFVPIGEHKFRDINEENGRLKKEIIDFNLKIKDDDDFRGKYFEVLNTASWKITQPLRSLKSILRRLKSVLKS